MACSASSSITIPGTGITVAIETLTTALSLFAAWYFYDKMEEDVDNMIDIGNQYMAIGEDYCKAASELRERTACLYDYVEALPEYRENGVYAQQAYATTIREVFPALRKAAGSIPADDPGGHCEVRLGVAEYLLEHGMAAAMDGDRYEITLRSRYYESIIKARTDAISQSTPNIAGSLREVAETLSRSAQENTQSFNGALYSVGRGVGTLYDRFTGRL